MARATIDLSGLLANIEARTSSAVNDLTEALQVKDEKIEALVKSIEAKDAQVRTLIQALEINDAKMDALTKVIEAKNDTGGLGNIRDLILCNSNHPHSPSSINNTDRNSKRQNCVPLDTWIGQSVLIRRASAS